MIKKIRIVLLFLLLGSLLHAVEQPNRGAVLYKQCAGCHGPDGKNKAFGKSGIIAGQSVEDLKESLAFYKASDFKTLSSVSVMVKQVKNLSDEDLNEVSNFISKLK